MNTQMAMAIASLIGIVPSFGLLWISMIPNEGRFHEKDTMMTFIFGLFIGIPVVVIHLFLSTQEYMTTVWFYPTAILLGLAEAAVYRTYLRRRKFSGRTDKPFLAFSLGLGISAIYILYISGRGLFFGYEMTEEVLGMIMFAMAVPMIRGSSGIIISKGEAKGEKGLKHMIRGGLLLGGFNLIAFLYIHWDYLWPFALACVGIGFFSYALFSGYLRTLPQIEEEEEDQ